MTAELLVRVLPERAQTLQARLVAHLDSADDERLRSLVASIGAEEGPITLVFTGQYNAGKSTLIAALTERDDIVIDSNVATTHAAAFQWGDVELIDTPGVQAGIELHDALTEEALRRADMVVFVVSVDLFDDAGVKHLRHVAFDLGKRPSMVAVVNKCGMLSANPGIRVDAVRKALGAGQSVPVVLTDARDHLDAWDESEEELRQSLLADGNIAGLAAALNGLTRQSGQESRLRRPFEQVLAVCGDAMELLAEDVKEKAARKILNRERRLIVASRRRLELGFEAEFQDYSRRIVNLGEDVADAVDGADDLQGGERQARMEDAERNFRERAEAETDQLLERIRLRIEQEARTAAREVKELEASPPVARLARPSTDWEASTVQPQATRRLETPEERDYHSILERVGGLAGAFSKQWAPEGARKASEYAGSFGHKTIYSIGKSLGKNWKPWEAVGVAKNVGNAAQFVNKATPFVAIGIDAFLAIRADIKEGQFLEERQKRRRTAIQDAERAASEVIMEVQSKLALAVAEFYSPALSALEKEQSDLDSADTRRAGLQEELRQLAASCRENLALLDVTPDND